MKVFCSLKVTVPRTIRQHAATAIRNRLGVWFCECSTIKKPSAYQVVLILDDYLHITIVMTRERTKQSVMIELDFSLRTTIYIRQLELSFTRIMCEYLLGS